MASMPCAAIANWRAATSRRAPWKTCCSVACVPACWIATLPPAWQRDSRSLRLCGRRNRSPCSASSRGPRACGCCARRTAVRSEDSMTSSQPMTARAMRELARAREEYAQGHLARAESRLLNVLSHAPGCVDALEGLAFVAAGRSDFAKAADWAPLRAAGLRAVSATSWPSPEGGAIRRRALYEHCLARVSPAFAVEHTGLVASMSRQLGGVLGGTDRARRGASHDADLHYKRGWPRPTERQVEEIEAYRRAIALQPDHVLARVNLGVALRDMHRLDEAMLAFDEAFAIDPAYPGAHTNRGQISLVLGRYAEGWASTNGVGATADRHCRSAWTSSGRVSSPSLAGPCCCTPNRALVTRCSSCGMPMSSRLPARA